MRVKTEEIVEAKENIEQTERETNAQATERIQAELRAKTKLEARRDMVMSYFFELTGVPMSELQFAKYNKKFDDPNTPAGYNIKSFIRDERIKVDMKVRTQNWRDTLKDVQDDKLSKGCEEREEAS
jgi:hypothetical protein